MRLRLAEQIGQNGTHLRAHRLRQLARLPVHIHGVIWKQRVQQHGRILQQARLYSSAPFRTPTIRLGRLRWSRSHYRRKNERELRRRQSRRLRNSLHWNRSRYDGRQFHVVHQRIPSGTSLKRRQRRRLPFRTHRVEQRHRFRPARRRSAHHAHHGRILLILHFVGNGAMAEPRATRLGALLSTLSHPAKTRGSRRLFSPSPHTTKLRCKDRRIDYSFYPSHIRRATYRSQ